MTFAAFMRSALYDPDDGFFRRNPVGTHFATAPTISPVFAACIATLLQRAHTELGDQPLTFLEAGASDGTLARAIALSAPGVTNAFSYIAVEQDPAARVRIDDEPPTFASAMSVPDVTGIAPFTGVVLANELFDNLPFHRLRARGGELREVYVTATGDGFAEHEAAPTSDAINAATRSPGDGEEITSSPAARTMFGALAQRMQRGYVIVIDYGALPGEPFEPARGYRAHTHTEDLLADPGSADITGPVDFAALAEEAQAVGLSTMLITQRELLYASGYRAFLDALAAQQKDAEAKGDHKRSVTLWNLRGEATALVAADQLGNLKVLIAATEGLEPLIQLDPGA